MSNVCLKFIGSGDAFASGGKFNTCFYLKYKQNGYLIDCGASSLVALRKNGLNSNDINYILISHFHGDHFAGLASLLMEASYIKKRKDPIYIIGPKSIQSKLQELVDLLYTGANFLEKLDIHYHEYRDYELFEMEDLKLEVCKVDHSPGASPHGLKLFLGEKIIAYSGDTEWTNSLIRLSDNADLFICECNFYDTEVKGHMNFQTLKNHIPQLNCKRIILTHLDEEMLKRKHELLMEVAEDGMELNF